VKYENAIPVRGVVALDQMAGEDSEDTTLLRAMASGAQNYVRGFSWCKNIRDVYFGDGVGGLVGVFLFRIEPSRQDVDEWLWVVFGDVPPAYLVTDVCKTPSQALEGYMKEMSKWVGLARQSQSSTSVIPVYVPATPENAADVEKRLQLLKEIILPRFREAETLRA
jgi:hypothetical protein